MQKLTHLEHLEDLLFSDTDKVVEALDDMHRGHVPFSLKWDGAPSIVFGKHPENGKFFLGTKSIFNVNPKINYSEDQIVRNHGDNAVLAQKLMYTFAVLRRAYVDAGEYRVFQADLLYTKADLMTDKMGTHSFMPNTLHYKPVRLDTNELIDKSLIGLAIHTEYMRDAGSLKLEDMHVRQIGTQPDFSEKIFQADIEVDSPRVTNGMFGSQVKAIMSKVSHQVFDDLVLTPGIWDLWKIFQNSQIKDDTINYEGKFEETFDLFKEWIVQRETTKMLKKKTHKGMQTNLDAISNYMMLLHNPKVKPMFVAYMEAREIVVKAKRQVLPRGNSYNGFYALSGSDPVGHEGLVGKLGDDFLFKIVDRQRFSKLNFHKNQKKFKK